MQQINIFYTRLELRITSSVASNIRGFQTSFLRNIFASHPRYWNFDKGSVEELFEPNILLFPFDSNGSKSLFVVIGAKNIRSYTSNLYRGSRPCIMHIDPNGSKSMKKHDHNAVAVKLRTWLNKAWRKYKNESDPLVMPFGKYSLPLIKPSGESIIHLLAMQFILTSV